MRTSGVDEVTGGVLVTTINLHKGDLQVAILVHVERTLSPGVAVKSVVSTGVGV